MNDERTCTESGAKLAHNVPEAFSGWPATRAAMIKRREVEGADSPKGHAISNLVEMGDNAETYVRPSWATDRRQTLPYLMAREAARLGAM
jgi:hypothetical protein